MSRSSRNRDHTLDHTFDGQSDAKGRTTSPAGPTSVKRLVNGRPESPLRGCSSFVYDTQLLGRSLERIAFEDMCLQFSLDLI